MNSQIISMIIGVDVLFCFISLPSATGYILDKFNI